MHVIKKINKALFAAILTNFLPDDTSLPATAHASAVPKPCFSVMFVYFQKEKKNYNSREH